MKNERGMSIVSLVIMTILIMIVTVIIINYGKTMLEQTKLQDLRTNMLLIQAETKKGLEQVCFNIVNLDETKEEDLAKINEVRQEYLAGTLVNNAPTEVQEATKNITDVTIDENCYYLDEATLTEMGIKEIEKNQYGYYIVKYDINNTSVEVMNTKGYNGAYTLTRLNQLIEGTPIEETPETVNEPVS